MIVDVIYIFQIENSLNILKSKVETERGIFLRAQTTATSLNVNITKEIQAFRNDLHLTNASLVGTYTLHDYNRLTLPIENVSKVEDKCEDKYSKLKNEITKASKLIENGNKILKNEIENKINDVTQEQISGEREILNLSDNIEGA